MAEIQEVFEDIGQGAKNLFKSKPFKFAAIGVGVVALYVGFTRNKEEDATAYGAIGYAGYPTVNGGGGEEMSSSSSESFDSAYFESLLGMMQAEQKDQISDLQSSIEDLYNKGDSFSSLESNEVEYRNQETESVLLALEREQDIAQMKANSELYNNISDRATKDALHAENLAIAEKWGWEYNSGSGNYFEGNSVLYTTSQQQANVLEGKKTPASNGTFVNNVDYQAEINKAITEGASAAVIDNLNAQRNAKIAASGSSTAKANATYDKNVDYQALINKAKASGASQDVINNLTAQREAKIKGENLNSDGTKKK